MTVWNLLPRKIAARPVDRDYEWLGGAGVRRALWECQTCGCAVSDKALHDRRCPR